MIKILEDAIERLRQMPEDRQDSLARLVLFEIDEDERWMQSTGQHADKLQSLVQEIVAANRREECEPLDPEKL